jgi:hypothetical protein
METAMLMLNEFEEFQVRSSLWHKQLDAAASPGDVVEILQDYAASLTPAQLGSLPERCRPGRLKDEDDIGYWTFLLAQHQCRPPDFDLGLFQDVLNHFLHASLRISELRKSRR